MSDVWPLGGLVHRFGASCPWEFVMSGATTSCQRWKERRASFREAPDLFDPKRHSVDLLEERVAKGFVTTHHYSGSYPAARVRVGLFSGVELVGVAVFAEPAQRATVPKYAPGATQGVVLARFVLLDEVAANAETWFLARSFKLLKQARPELQAVVSYADPVRRQSITGDVTLPGHVGTIYQAFNGAYLGRSRPEKLVLDPAGRVVSRRALSKLRNGEQGRDYTERLLVAAGAPTRLRDESGAAYVERALRDGPFRILRHPGNHVYAWPLTKGVTLASRVDIFPKLVEPSAG